MNMTITVDPAQVLAVLDERGWTQGRYDDDHGVCLHGAIRLCAPQPGDAHLIEQVARMQGWGPAWNDADDRTEAEVRARIAEGIDITDADLAATFGPQWRAVVDLVRRAASVTGPDAAALNAALHAALNAALSVARDAALSVARDATQLDAALNAALYAVAPAAAQLDGALIAVQYATRAVATWDLATPDGTYTTAHRDLLIGPWRTVCGLPDGLLDTVEVTP